MSARLQAVVGDRYRIERLLGEGGMASVFLAEDCKHHRSVAIKVLDPELAAIVGAERFEREIDTAARLTHPNIVPLFDSGASGGLLYYVMPYVPGESLRARLEREGPLPVADALRVAIEVADALEHAHRAGIVHRDIKPENVLLEAGHAVVADFGLARALGAVGPQALTQSGLMVGTPAYMSPEQVTTSRALDGRSDQYALACLLYELLAGQPPFMGGTSQSVLHQHLHVAPRPVTELRPNVPARVSDALQRALSKAPADRFANAAAFAAALVDAREPHSADVSRPAVSAGAPTLPAHAPQDRAAGPHEGARATRARAAWARARWLGFAGAVVILSTIAGDRAWRIWGPGAQVARPPRQQVFVAEFDGPAGDGSLARVAREIVCAALDRSPVLVVVPFEQVQLALLQSDRPETTRVSSRLARELAYRLSVRTLVEGEILPLDRRYAATLRVHDVEQGRQIFSITEVAASDDALIPVLSRMAGRVRGRLGGDPRDLQSTRIDQMSVATPSFEAYRLWAEGTRLYYGADFTGALERHRLALLCDPGFSAVWLGMAETFRNLGAIDSAITYCRAALREPSRLTPAERLFAEGQLACWRGDAVVALQSFERVSRLYPGSNPAHEALNREAVVLMSQGRFEEALERQLRSDEGRVVSDIAHQVRASALIGLGRFREARREADEMRGWYRQQTEVNLALAVRDWRSADSLALALEREPLRERRHVVAAATARAATAAVRGEWSAADAQLRRAEAAESRPAWVPRLGRHRLTLALACGRPLPPAPASLDSDSSTSALITRAYGASAGGQIDRARALVAVLRSRPSARLGAHGSTLEFVEAWMAARLGRWSDVIEQLEPAARDGRDRGNSEFDRIGVAPERWLVAHAYERLARPDSAAAFYERVLAPESNRLLDAPARLRLVVLYAGMGRITDAERHLAVLRRDFIRPDPDARQQLDEAARAVQDARGRS